MRWVDRISPEPRSTTVTPRSSTIARTRVRASGRQGGRGRLGADDRVVPDDPGPAPPLDRAVDVIDPAEPRAWLAERTTLAQVSVAELRQDPAGARQLARSRGLADAAALGGLRVRGSGFDVVRPEAVLSHSAYMSHSSPIRIGRGTGRSQSVRGPACRPRSTIGRCHGPGTRCCPGT